MNWYKKAILFRKASLSFYINDYNRDETFDSVFNISYHLNSQLFKWLTEQEINYYREFKHLDKSSAFRQGSSFYPLILL